MDEERKGMSLNILIAFWGVSILFQMTPGIDWAYAIFRDTRQKSLACGNRVINRAFDGGTDCCGGCGHIGDQSARIASGRSRVLGLFICLMGLSLSMRPASISQ